MTDTTARLVDSYYEMLKDGVASFDADRLREILAADLEFEGPIAGRRIGAEGFIQGAARFAEAMRGMTVLQHVRAGDQASALYDAYLPGGTVRFAEFFRVADGRIASLRLLYDAGEYRARGGR